MKPLDGVKVVDLTRHMAGPYATQMLSDFGADVIKVESVPHGDPVRRTGTAFSGDESALFLIWNRGKRSLAIDMRSPRPVPGGSPAGRVGRHPDRELPPRRGRQDRPRLRLSEDGEPGLIYIALSAFGSNGPWSEDPGTDPVVQAMSGVMSVTGESDGGPLLIGVPIADYAGAMTAAQAAMLGLIAREPDRHRPADRDLDAEALISALTTRLASWWYGGRSPASRQPNTAWSPPTRPSAPPTAGRWPGCGAPGPPGRASARRSTAPTSSSIPTFADNQLRVDQSPGAERDPGADLRDPATAEWRDRFHDAKALFGPVYSVSEAVSQDQIKHRDFVTSIEHPTLGDIPRSSPQSPSATRRVGSPRHPRCSVSTASRCSPSSDTARRRSIR